MPAARRHPTGRSAAGPLVVIGDALLDVDLVGRAGRLAPDSPVPVLDDLQEVRRPGGAALAAALAAGDVDEVVLLTALPDDQDGATLADLLAAAGVQLVRVPHSGATPVKRRVRAAGQSLLRLDSGGGGSLGTPPRAALDAVASAAAVLVSDYGRGTPALPQLRDAIAGLPGRVPVVWDPHPRGAAPVPGARLVAPNQQEAAAFAAALGLDRGEDTGGRGSAGLAALSRQAAGLVRGWSAHAVAITLGSRGALLSHGESSPSVVPAPTVTATDPCGAGDRFAATAAVALAGGAVMLEAVQAAVHSASDFVATGGAAAYVAPPAAPNGGDPGDRVRRVREAGGTVVATGGCFDLLHAGHVATLEAARALGDCLVVCVNSDASVRRLKGPGRPLVPEADRARVLRALSCVDEVVVFDEDTPVEALRAVRPDVWAKGGDYAGAELPEAALLAEWGGQSVVLPYLDGRSTTRLVISAAERAATQGASRR